MKPIFMIIVFLGVLLGCNKDYPPPNNPSHPLPADQLGNMNKTPSPHPHIPLQKPVQPVQQSQSDSKPVTPDQEHPETLPETPPPISPEEDFSEFPLPTHSQQDTETSDDEEDIEEDAEEDSEEGGFWNWVASFFSQDSKLHDAVEDRDIKKVRQLIASGHDVNAEDHFGRTPLHTAVEEGQFAIIKVLVENGADTNVKDTSFYQNGLTPLHRAVIKKRLDLVRFLAMNGARINEYNGMKETPLHVAAEEGHYDIVRYLVHQGAHIHLKNEDKKTALQLAQEKSQESNSHKQIEEFLTQYQATPLEESRQKEQVKFKNFVSYKF